MSKKNKLEIQMLYIYLKQMVIFNQYIFTRLDVEFVNVKLLTLISV